MTSRVARVASVLLLIGACGCAEESNASEPLTEDVGAGTPDTDATPADAVAEDGAGGPELPPAEDGGGGSDEGAGVDTEADSGGGPPPGGTYDCDNLPAGPFPLVELNGPIASEDLAFDRDGHLIGSNDKAIFRSVYGGAEPSVWVPSLSFRAGLRFLPNGDLIVCNNNEGELQRIDTTGAVHPVLTNLSYPNGVRVDLEGRVYFTEQSTDLVHRVNPFTGEDVIITNKVAAPNGLTFSPDYRTLYVGGFSGEGVIYAISLSAEGVPGKPVPWATGVGSGALDGMATDACGNVYVADYGLTEIFRITPDGKTKTVIIDGSSLGAYLPNMQWGSGYGGWDSQSMYLPNGWEKTVFEVKLGVPSAARPFP